MVDANFNVAGITDAAGAVKAQYTYDAYGQVVAADFAATPAGFALFNRVGHQGLFADRFDVEGMQVPGVPGTGGSGGGPTPAQVGAVTQRPALAPYAFTGIQNRHRTLLPAHGRYAQKDPNASGMVLGSLASHGQAAHAWAAPFDAQSLYTDGVNLFGYLGSSPVGRTDALGLFSTAGLAPAAPGMAASLFYNAMAGALFGGAAGGISGALDPNVGFWSGAAHGAVTGGVFGLGFGAASGAISAYASTSGLGVLSGVLGRYTVPSFVGGAYASYAGGLYSGSPPSVTQMLNDAAVAALFGSAFGYGADRISAAFAAGAAGGLSPVVTIDKMGYLFRRDAGGNALTRIGLSDTPATREYLKRHFTDAYLSGMGRIDTAKAGGPQIESLLQGHLGWVKAVSNWTEDGRFITAWFKGV